MWATLTAGGVGGLGYWTAWCVCASLEVQSDLLTTLPSQLPARSAPSLSLALRPPLRRSTLTSPHRTLADVLKSRIQNAEQPPRGANYIINTFKQIYRQEGARAFIAGLTPTCASSLTYSRSRLSTDELSPMQICERACAPPRRAASTSR